MSRVVTEIVNLTFNSDTEIDKPMTRLTEILSKQEGLRRIKWGRWEEDANKIQMMINWDDISSHYKFMQGPAYPNLLATLDGLLAVAPALIHAHFDEEAINKVLDDPVVELATFYGITEGFEEAVDRTLAVGSDSEGCLRYTRGDVVEEISPSETEPKGKAHYAAISWTSVQARLDATTRKEVQESGQAVVSKVGGYEVHHVRFQ